MKHPLPYRGRLAAAMLAIALSGTIQAAMPAAAPDTIKVGDYSVQMATLGAGNYTVILEAGFGRDLGVWRKVAPALATSAKVVAYSRAGHGKSDPRPEAPTIAARTSELEQLIATAGLKPPFVLVGHSYGGFLIRSYAARHPEQVAGMVFVDPSDEQFNVELRKLDAAAVDKDSKLTEQFMPPKFHAELRSVQAERLMKASAGKYSTSDNVQDSYGEMLLAAGKPLEAKLQFMRAITLAEAQGKNEKVLAGYRANLAKAEGALPR